MRVATAHTELDDGREMKFGPGVVEVDGTKMMTTRATKKNNTHTGRFLIIYHRDTKQYALEPLNDKDVMKGAPPPLEAYEEIRGSIVKKLKAGHILASDSAKAFKKVANEDLKKIGVPHVTVVHKKKQFAAVQHVPVMYLHNKLRDQAVLLPTCTSRTFRVVAGDNGAESLFSLVKRNIKRMNLQFNAKNIRVNVLSTANLQKNVGFNALVKSIAKYTARVTDTVHPAKAFVGDSFVTECEKV